MNFDWLLTIIGSLILAILEAVSPQIRELVLDFIQHLEEEAAKTPNKFDDELVHVLRVVFGLP